MNNKDTYKGLLLRIPASWVRDLDILAKANHCTRTALLRNYVKASIDQSYSQLVELKKIVDRNKSVAGFLENYLDEDQPGNGVERKPKIL